MGELDLNKAENVAEEIKKIIEKESEVIEVEKEESKTKWICPVCGYVHYGDNPPEVCPLCGIPGDKFIKEEA